MSAPSFPLPVPASRNRVLDEQLDVLFDQISALPAGPSRALTRLASKTARLHDSITVPAYPGR